jgi:hypothetical protein
MGGVQGIAAALRSDPKTGLFGDELEPGKDEVRVSRYGTNVYEQVNTSLFWLISKSDGVGIYCMRSHP